jgi:hypothetical protein
MAALAKDKGSYIVNTVGSEVGDLRFNKVKSLWPTTVITSLKNSKGKDVTADYISNPAGTIAANAEIAVLPDDQYFTAIELSGAGSIVELTLD